MPRWFIIAAALLIVFLVLVPVVVITRLRAETSVLPRVHLITDMDDQPKLKTQRADTFFPDGRAMRPPVADTLALGDLPTDAHFATGKVGEQWAATFPARLPVTDALRQRGRERFDIFCAPCHGLDGTGGIVSARATALGDAAWVKPPMLDDERLLKQPPGQIFGTITNGLATMPSYAVQIPAADRWAIVAHVRALQRARHATPADVPPEQMKAQESERAGPAPAKP